MSATKGPVRFPGGPDASGNAGRVRVFPGAGREGTTAVIRRRDLCSISTWQVFMRFHDISVSGIRITGLVSVMLLLSTGCVSAWWNAFLDPTQVGNFRETNVVNEIQETISFRDKPTGIANAVDPTPDDLVAVVEEYKIGPGDVIQIRILDFLVRDVETELAVTVDELGFVVVPQLGQIRAEGLSAEQLRGELIQRAKARDIYSLDVEPTVVVTLLTQQHRTFNVSGTVAGPSAYGIPRPDFRLREAINLAGGLDETVRTIYVFRGAKREKRIEEGVGLPSGPPLPEDEEFPAPPVTPSTGWAVVGGPAPSAGEVGGVPQPTTRSGEAGDLALPAEEVERDLIEAIGPGSATDTRGSPQDQPATTPVD